MPGIFPKQTITKAEKKANDYQFYKDSTQYIIDQSNFFSSDRWEMIELYQAAMGYLNKDAYKFILNPYNTPDENLKNYPAQLRNYDNIIPILNLFLGEKANRPFNHEVVVANPDTGNKDKDDLDQAFIGVMAQHFVNNLNAQGVQTGVESKEIPPYDKFLKENQINASEKRAKFGQEALDYIKHSLSLKDRYQEGYFDWLVTGRVYTYKDVYKNDLLHEIVPPLELWHGPTKTGFVEDANWAYRRTRLNLNDIIDRFHEELEEDQVKALEEKYRQSDGLVSNSISTTINIDSQVDKNLNSNSILTNNRGLIEVHHTTWKGFEKVGILKYMDDLGGLQEMEVDETYILNKENGDIEIEWDYMSVAHETYRIDADIHIYMRPLQVQRHPITNTSICKLPYNGRSGYSERNKITSVVKQCVPYQALINTYHFRLEMIIAKNKEKFMTMPLGLIPDGNGWSMEKFLYFGDTTSILFVDETKPNAQAALNAIKSIDMGLGNYMEQMKNLIIATKDEMWDSIGMNRQRYGDVNSSDGKGNNEQAVFRSSVISREMNRRFEKFEESDLQGLLENSKVGWMDGKKGAYINSEGRKAFLDLDGKKHLDTDYGVFVVDSQDEQAKLAQAKQYAFGFAQKQGTPASTVIDILDSNNMSKLKALVNKSETIQKEYEAEVAKSQHDNAIAIEQEKQKSIQTEGQITIEKAHIAADASIQVAIINNSGNDGDADSSEDLNKAYDNYVNKVKDQDLKKQKDGLGVNAKTGDTRLKEAQLEEAKQKRLSAEKIAKENKNKYG